MSPAAVVSVLCATLGWNVARCWFQWHAWKRARRPLRGASRLSRHVRYGSLAGGRQRTARLVVTDELPYAVELLGLCCMSGMSLLQAIDRVGALGEGAVCHALREASRNFAAGMSRDEALGCLSTQLGTRAADSLVAALRQSESSGTPVVEILRCSAQAARKEGYLAKMRLVEAIPLKLVVCTAVLLFPALMIMALGPQVIAFLTIGF